MPNSGLCSLSVCLNCSPVLHVVFDVVCTIYALWVNENLTNNYYYYHTPHIFYWNCRSLSNKLTHFQSFVYSSPFHVIASSETWLTDKIYSREILSSGYTLYRSDRNTRGGGVLVCVSSSLSSHLIVSYSSIDMVVVKIQTSPPRDGFGKENRRGTRGH